MLPGSSALAANTGVWVRSHRSFFALNAYTAKGEYNTAIGFESMSNSVEFLRTQCVLIRVLVRCKNTTAGSLWRGEFYQTP